MPRTKKTMKRGTSEYREFMRTIGRKGGNQTKKRMLAKNPDYYANIGYQGGATMKKRGFEFYSEIGKIGSRKQWHGEERS